MISDKERREAARKLRALDTHDWYDSADEIDSLESAVECNVFQRFESQTWWHRLADLIEPQERTCKIEGTYDDEYGIYDHLTCGHVAMRQWPEPTSYCPHCGAEVVRSED